MHTRDDKAREQTQRAARILAEVDVRVAKMALVNELNSWVRLEKVKRKMGGRERESMKPRASSIQEGSVGGIATNS
jgi:hypothetical protein